LFVCAAFFLWKFTSFAVVLPCRSLGPLSLSVYEGLVRPATRFLVDGVSCAPRLFPPVSFRHCPDSRPFPCFIRSGRRFRLLVDLLCLLVFNSFLSLSSSLFFLSTPSAIGSPIMSPPGLSFLGELLAPPLFPRLTTHFFFCDKDISLQQSTSSPNILTKD